MCVCCVHAITGSCGVFCNAHTYDCYTKEVHEACVSSAHFLRNLGMRGGHCLSYVLPLTECSLCKCWRAVRREGRQLQRAPPSPEDLPRWLCIGVSGVHRDMQGPHQEDNEGAAR
eukprot:SAG25_NODE_4745_length_756_cov_1.579909_2_plen_114_part_01